MYRVIPFPYTVPYNTQKESIMRDQGEYDYHRSECNENERRGYPRHQPWKVIDDTGRVHMYDAGPIESEDYVSALASQYPGLRVVKQ